MFLADAISAHISLFKHFKTTTYQTRYQECSLLTLFFLEKYSKEAGICENQTC